MPVTVFSHRFRYAGTFDLLARLPELGLTLIDIKTNRSGPFAEAALQLAAYAHADFYVDGRGAEVPMPETSAQRNQADCLSESACELSMREGIAAGETSQQLLNRVPRVFGFYL